MKKRFFTILFLGLGLNIWAQEVDQPTLDEGVGEQENPIFPKFEAGEQALLDYIKSNLVYPAEAAAKGVEGVVFIRFQVDVDGTIVEPFMASEDLGYGTGQEAIRIIRSTSGKWTPALIGGKPIKLMLQIPIKFSLKQQFPFAK